MLKSETVLLNMKIWKLALVNLENLLKSLTFQSYFDTFISQIENDSMFRLCEECSAKTLVPFLITLF